LRFPLSPLRLDFLYGLPLGVLHYSITVNNVMILDRWFENTPFIPPYKVIHHNAQNITLCRAVQVARCVYQHPPYGSNLNLNPHPIDHLSRLIYLNAPAVDIIPSSRSNIGSISNTHPIIHKRVLSNPAATAFWVIRCGISAVSAEAKEEAWVPCSSTRWKGWACNAQEEKKAWQEVVEPLGEEV
jgi:hypothetical protein